MSVEGEADRAMAPDMLASLQRLRSDSANSPSKGPSNSGAVPGSSKAPSSNIEAARRRAIENYRYFNAEPPKLAEVRDIEAPGAFGPRRIRLYRNNLNAAPQPVLIYAHGGGWIVGDLELEHWALSYLASQANFAVASLDYVLAPEHPFPQPIEDCVALTQWLRANGARFGLDTNRIAIGGASAGANLAVATALMLRDRSQNWLSSITSFYGVFSTHMQSDSHKLFADNRYHAGSPGMEFFLSKYLAEPKDRSHPLLHLVAADLAGLPPVYLSIAELDTLRDDSLILSERLTAADVPNHYALYPGTVHGFTVMAKAVSAARQALRDAATHIELRFAVATDHS